MIAKGTPHRDGAILARYLVTGKARESAELWELRGFPCTAIIPAFRSVHVMAAATKCLAPFFHVSVRNPDGDKLDRSQWELVANCVERMLGLTDQPRAVAFHTAADTGHAHMHIAWSRIDHETLTAKPLPFFKLRLKQVCRELEERFGLTSVPNERRSSIHFAPTRAEEEQARRLGVDVHAARESIRACFERSDCGRSFRDALAHQGLVLVRGDRRDFLVVDGIGGGVQALGKRILGVAAAEIRDRLTDLCPEQLPTLEQARHFIATTKPIALVNNLSDDCRPAKDLPKPVIEPRRTRHGTAETKERRHGKDQPPHAIRLPPVGAQSADLPDHTPRDPLPPARSLDSETSTIDDLRNMTLHPEAGVAQNHELQPATTGSPEPTSRAASRDKTARKPVIEAVDLFKQPPPAYKAPRHTTGLRVQFRAVVKQLTAKVLGLRLPPRKRRGEEMGGAFRRAGFGILRSVARIPPLHFLDPTWEPFTWLHLWEYNSGVSTDFHQDRSASPPPEDLSLRL